MITNSLFNAKRLRKKKLKPYLIFSLSDSEKLLIEMGSSGRLSQENFCFWKSLQSQEDKLFITVRPPGRNNLESVIVSTTGRALSDEEKVLKRTLKEKEIRLCIHENPKPINTIITKAQWMIIWNTCGWGTVPKEIQISWEKSIRLHWGLNFVSSLPSRQRKDSYNWEMP